MRLVRIAVSSVRALTVFHSSLAQLVERLTVNQVVGGSSPSRGALSNKAREEGKDSHGGLSVKTI